MNAKWISNEANQLQAKALHGTRQALPSLRRFHRRTVWTAEANIRTNPKTSGITVNTKCLSADAELMLLWCDKPDPAALPRSWETHQRPPADASGRGER